MSAETPLEAVPDTSMLAPLTEKQATFRDLLRSKQKIALVGFTESRTEAPFDDPEWLVGGCNNLHKQIPYEKCDFWFDMHPTDLVRQDKDHETWMKGGHLPVAVIAEQEDWPSSLNYPRHLVESSFPPYFTNTISQQIALILMWAQDTMTDFGVFGVDMATSSEYSAQRPSVEFFLGCVYARGIRMHIPKQSDLLKCAAQYGFEDDSPMRIKMDARGEDIKRRLQQTEQQIGQLTAVSHQMRGALEDLQYWRNVWMTPSANRDGSRKIEEGTAVLGQEE